MEIISILQGIEKKKADKKSYMTEMSILLKKQKSMFLNNDSSMKPEENEE
jgi:hypothetical protein